MTSGRVLWAASPADPYLAPLLAAECSTLSRLLADSYCQREAEATERALTALLATLED